MPGAFPQKPRCRWDQGITVGLEGNWDMIQFQVGEVMVSWGQQVVVPIPGTAGQEKVPAGKGERMHEDPAHGTQRVPYPPGQGGGGQSTQPGFSG